MGHVVYNMIAPYALSPIAQDMDIVHRVKIMEFTAAKKIVQNRNTRNIKCLWR